MWLSLLAMVAFHSEEVRPLRPSDSELLEAVVAKHPSGRILSATFKNSP